MTRGESRRSTGLGVPPAQQRRGRLFALVCMVAAIFPVVLGAALLGAAIESGAGFGAHGGLGKLSSVEAGSLLGSALGSLWLVSMALAIALPIGVGVALHLEGPRSRMRSLLALNIANLAAVPSVLFGLVGLELFVRALRLGHGMLAAAFTLALVVLPIVAVAARAALRAVPDELREGGYALGATPWQVTRQVVLPAALPGMLSGAILAIARAFGEAAPLLLVAGFAATSSPSVSGDPRQILPLHVFQVLAEPDGPSRADAAMSVAVLLGTLLVLAGWAMRLRHRHERRRDG